MTREPKWFADLARRGDRMPNAEQLRELIAHVRELYAILDDGVGCPRGDKTHPCWAHLRAGCLRSRDEAPT